MMRVHLALSYYKSCAVRAVRAFRSNASGLRPDPLRPDPLPSLYSNSPSPCLPHLSLSHLVRDLLLTRVRNLCLIDDKTSVQLGRRPGEASAFKHKFLTRPRLAILLMHCSISFRARLIIWGLKPTDNELCITSGDVGDVDTPALDFRFGYCGMSFPVHCLIRISLPVWTIAVILME